jgi:uncharacterized protein YcnI
MRNRLWQRAGLILAATVTGVLVSGPAWAHVTVSPDEAEQGGFATVAFRVPNEQDGTDTVKVEVNLPTDRPIASVSIQPVAGWNAQTVTTKLPQPIKTDDGEVTEAISKITWTAIAGGGVKPGQFQQFNVSLGPLPETGMVIFKVLQTYSNGEIVRWIDPPATGGGPEPEHPAPVLKLTKAGGETQAGPGKAPSNDNTLPIVLAVIGLVVGAAGLVVGALGYRKASATPTTG